MRFHPIAATTPRSAAEVSPPSEDEFRALIDRLPQLAWIADSNGAALWLNARWYEYTGTSFDEMKGHGWESVVHPDHVARVFAAFRGSVASGSAFRETYPLRGRNGHFRWFLSRAEPARNVRGEIRWIGTNTDVTEARLLDEASRLLIKSLDVRERLDSLGRVPVPDLADCCIVLMLEDDHLRPAAVAHVDEAKLDRARAVARALSNLPDTHHLSGSVLRREIADSGSDEQRALRELGAVSYTAAPLTVRIQPIGVIYMIMAESGRRYSCSDLPFIEELGVRGGVAIDNARLFHDQQTAVRTREHVLSVVSHDLRNPLGAIDLGATLLLQSYGADPYARKQLGVIRRSADRMEHLINDLLDVARIGAGRFTITRSVVDARQLLDDVLEMHELIAKERGIALRRAYDLTGETLLCDRNRIAQVLDNLLQNALKFCGKGDVIVVGGVRIADEIRLAVRDSGPGIAASELPYVFEPYFSGEDAKKKGTGLGLPISKAIVEAHGGSLTVESVEGHGATFTITLPVASEPAR